MLQLLQPALLLGVHSSLALSDFTVSGCRNVPDEKFHSRATRFVVPEVLHLHFPPGLCDGGTEDPKNSKGPQHQHSLVHLCPLSQWTRWETWPGPERLGDAPGPPCCSNPREQPQGRLRVDILGNFLLERGVRARWGLPREVWSGCGTQSSAKAGTGCSERAFPTSGILNFNGIPRGNLT